MPLALAGISAMMFGVADFVGGFVTRRAPVLTVVGNAQAVGLVAVAVAAPIYGGSPGAATGLLWGAGGGIASALGLVLLYHALATTRISVAAPVAAVVGTVLPVLFGVVVGERPSPLAWVGMLAAVPAVVLLSASRGHSGSAARAAALGSAAGAAFALFGILLSRTGGDTGLWPLVAARGASVVVLVVAAAGTRRPLAVERSLWAPVCLSALLDIGGNVLFLVAVRQELLSLVSVIMSLYPAATIALARIVLGERVRGRQWLGLILAGSAVVLIALR